MISFSSPLTTVLAARTGLQIRSKLHFSLFLGMAALIKHNDLVTQALVSG